MAENIADNAPSAISTVAATVLPRAMELYAEVCGRHPDPAVSLNDDNADSLEVLEWFFAIEEEYGFRIPDERLAEINVDMSIAEALRVVTAGLC